MKEKLFPRLQERCIDAVLPNGLRVRVLPKPEFEKFYAVLAVDYGALDMDFLQDGKRVSTPAGVAHYLEHKLFDLPNGNAMQGFTRCGGTPNAFTGYEMTAYYVSGADHAEENLRVLLEMVATPYFTEESVEKERGIITEEIRMYADNANAQIYERLYAEMFPSHPVSISIAGNEQSIQAIDADTLLRCYRAFYRPSNMMLCVAGRFSPERVCEIAMQAMPVATGAPGERLPAQKTPLHTSRTERRMDVAMPMFYVGVRLPDAAPGDWTAEIAGDLAAELVCGEASACYERLYRQGLIDSGFYTGFERIRELSMLSFGGDSEDPDAVCKAVFAAAERLRQEGIDSTELARLKRSAIGRRLRDLDGFGGTCNRICAYSFDGLEYLDFRAAIEAVTERQILDVLAHFVEEHACRSQILPRETQETQEA